MNNQKYFFKSKLSAAMLLLLFLVGTSFLLHKKQKEPRKALLVSACLLRARCYLASASFANRALTLLGA